MSRKVVDFTMPPKPVSPDDWVAAKPEMPGRPPEPTKRLTLDVPASLHRRAKVGAAEHGTTLADIVRELLMERFPASP